MPYYEPVTIFRSGVNVRLIAEGGFYHVPITTAYCTGETLLGYSILGDQTRSPNRPVKDSHAAIQTPLGGHLDAPSSLQAGVEISATGSRARSASPFSRFSRRSW